MDGTILSQGSFLASNPVANQYVAVPSGVDWMRVVNFTQYGNVGGAAPYGVEYFWQVGMPSGYALVKYYSNGSAIFNGDVIVAGGFTLYDPSGQTVGAEPLLSNPVATTATTNAVRPVVSTSNTAGLYVGSVVRLSQTAQTDVNGIDMVVSAVTANTSFELLAASNALANVPGAIGGAGFYTIVNYNPLYYPRKLYVTNITQSSSPVVSTSIAHGLTPGQQVRFTIPQVSGMVQLNGLAGIITSVVDDYSFHVNVNTSGFSAFTWPTIAQQPSSFPLIVPFGEDTATSLSTVAAQVPSIGGVQINGTQSGILADATVNTGYLGMILGAGGYGNITDAEITGPAGSVAADYMFWVAGKSSYANTKASF